MNATLETIERSGSLAVTDATFGAEVLQSPRPVLVDFWAPWCGPCRMIAPALEELAAEFAGSATIAKLDVDENPQTAATFNIRGIPTMLIFKNGQVVDRIVGLTAKPKLAAKLTTLLA